MDTGRPQRHDWDRKAARACAPSVPIDYRCVQAETARALAEAELANSDWDYSEYNCQVVIVEPD